MHGEFRSALIMNYMIDMSWLICSVPRLTDPNVAVCCVHGEKGGALASTIVSMGLYNWSCSEADLGPERFGTHHSKMIIMRYDTGVRVVIMTANLIEDDFDYRTQGVFIQDFPLKSGHDPPPRASSRGDGSGASVPLSHSNRALAFKHDLVDYLNHVAVKGADTQAALRSHTTMLDRYDFSGAEVCIVASVPGRHAASAAKWGHLKLRRCLQTALKTTDGNGTSGCSSGGGGGVGHIACQYSSTGSMGKGEVYLDELKESFSATAASSNSGSTLSLHRGAVRMELIWPTVECVRSSLQGYASGGSLPCNVASIYDVDERGGRPLRIKEGFARLLHKWEGAPPARHAATPHIKSFCRYRERSEGIGVDLDWFLLTSKNLSQAAWGVLQTNKTKLYIKSYEIGVLFIRGEVKTNRRLFSCTPKHPVLGLDCTDMSGCDSAAVMSDSGCTMGVMISDRHDGDAPDITFDIPYKLPPCKYTLGPGVGGTSAEVDVPWCWDRVYATPDRFGNKWTGGV
jgi:tyrosyl-DNA phosphodiesterase-1